jgi:hypothetical protein
VKESTVQNLKAQIRPTKHGPGRRRLLLLRISCVLDGRACVLCFLSRAFREVGRCRYSSCLLSYPHQPEAQNEAKRRVRPCLVAAGQSDWNACGQQGAHAYVRVPLGLSARTGNLTRARPAPPNGVVTYVRRHEGWKELPGDRDLTFGRMLVSRSTLLSFRQG